MNIPAPKDEPKSLVEIVNENNIVTNDLVKETQGLAIAIHEDHEWNKEQHTMQVGENMHLWKFSTTTRILVGISFGFNGAALILAGIAYLT